MVAANYHEFTIFIMNSLYTKSAAKKTVSPLKGRPAFGKDGRPVHEAMIHLIPWVIHALQRAWPDMNIGGSIDDMFTRVLMRQYQAGRKGIKQPDGIIVWDGGGALIEIGMCNADKWPQFPWIHWSFAGYTTVINNYGDDPMVEEVATYLEIAAENSEQRLVRLTAMQRAA